MAAGLLPFTTLLYNSLSLSLSLSLGSLDAYL